MNNSLGITIEEMLQLEVLKPSKILSGKGGLGRRITKMNVMEVPDIVNWVGKGEFLLTTAYSIKDNIQKLQELIPQFNNKEVAGIGIKMKRYIDTIPQEILELADKLDFPIIELPFDISYSEIITPTLTEIINTQTSILLKIDRFHNRLMNVMLKGGSLKEIADAINQSIDSSVAIVENIFENHVFVGDERISAHFEKSLDKIIRKKPYIDRLNREHSSYYLEKDKIDGQGVNRIVIPIVTKDKNYGYIIIWEDNKSLSPVELKVILASIPIIALDLIKKLSIFEIENKYKIEFFNDLLSKDESRQKRALSRASFFDFDRNLTYSVITIQVKDMEKIEKVTPNNSNYLHYANGRLLNIIEKLTRFRKEKIICGNKSDSLIILFGTISDNKERIKGSIIEFCKEVGFYISKELGKKSISIGIGRSYENINDLWKSYDESKRAASNLKKIEGDIPIHYDDLGIYRILCYEELQPELIQFYKEILEPLVKYDRDKDSEMIRTLRMYFSCGGNLKKISEEMYTHYNTIIYRVQRIQDITGLQLDNPNDRLNAEISLKIYDILKENQI